MTNKDIVNILDVLMQMSIKIDISTTEDKTLHDCAIKAQSLLMSILKNDGFKDIWSEQLEKQMKLYKELCSLL